MVEAAPLRSPLLRAAIGALGLCCIAAPRAGWAQEPPPVAVAPPPPPPPVPPPWRFGAELGITDISGNRDLQLFQGSLTAEHRSQDAFVLNTKVEARYGQSADVVAVSNVAYRLRFDWRPRAPVSPFLGGDAERDRIRRINLRVSGGTGANFNLDVRDGRRVTLALGLLLEYDRFAADVVPREVSETRFHSRLAVLRALRPGVDLEINGKFQPVTSALDDYLAAGDASVRVGLSTHLSFRTKYEWRRDSSPAPGVLSKDDRILTVSLLYTWS